MSKIRKLSIIAMIILVPMMLYYPYEGLRWNLELSFLDWGRWTRNDNWVDPEAQIALVTRTVFFVLWAVPTVVRFAFFNRISLDPDLMVAWGLAEPNATAQ